MVFCRFHQTHSPLPSANERGSLFDSGCEGGKVLKTSQNQCLFQRRIVQNISGFVQSLNTWIFPLPGAPFTRARTAGGKKLPEKDVPRENPGSA